MAVLSAFWAGVLVVRRAQFEPQSSQYECWPFACALPSVLVEVVLAFWAASMLARLGWNPFPGERV